MFINPEVDSSYQFHALGKTLYDQIRWLKPDKVIEFGVLNGYSTICIAQALRENGKGKVYAYDLFDKYEYTHSKRKTFEKNLMEYGVRDFVEIEEKNFFDWLKDPEHFDVLHFDISNTGDILDMVWESLKDSKGTILFEGGTEERDRCGWMVQYNKKPLNQSVAKFQVINNRFPSISKFICESES